MRTVDFLFEIGMLKDMPRTGWLTIGITEPESIAEHSFRTAVIGMVLAKLEHADEKRVLKMCLFHDLEETRLGDLHKINKIYLKPRKNAYVDILGGLPFRKELTELLDEFKEGKTNDSQVARDADKLEMILQAKEYLDVGNSYVKEWITSGMAKLKTKSAKKLSKRIINGDSRRWLFEIKNSKSPC
ncbi:MAG: HD domain-containing protein [Candidatus Micrarchaeota archaeon]